MNINLWLWEREDNTLQRALVPICVIHSSFLLERYDIQGARMFLDAQGSWNEFKRLLISVLNIDHLTSNLFKLVYCLMPRLRMQITVITIEMGDSANGRNKNSNIVHYSSVKCHRVTRSVLAAEMYALTHAFDVAYNIFIRCGSMWRQKFHFAHSRTHSHSLIVSRSWELLSKSASWSICAKVDLRASSPLFNLITTNKFQSNVKVWVNSDVLRPK
jgi:hypothetical protein